jgi:hypothetical protein
MENEHVFDQIKNIRISNNENWMDLLKLAFEVSPDKAKSIMNKIIDCDEKIKTLCKELIR